MLDMLATLGVASGLAVAACLAAILGAVLPFVIATEMAERRGFSTDRWGGLALAGIALGVFVGAAVVVQDRLILLLLPAVALTWSVPGVLLLLDPSQSRVGGPQGRHLR